MMRASRITSVSWCAEMLNTMLDAEADVLCGAQRYERSPDRGDTRAGSYERSLYTKAGEVKLKCLSCAVRPSRAPLSSVTGPIEEYLIGVYLAGSVRRVEDITEALWGTRVSSGTVSKMNQKVYQHIERWRNRPIEGEYPCVYLDSIVLKRSWADETKNVSVLVAVGSRSGWMSSHSRCSRRLQGRRIRLEWLSVSLQAARPQGRTVDYLGCLPGSRGIGGRLLPVTRRRAGNAAEGYLCSGKPEGGK